MFIKQNILLRLLGIVFISLMVSCQSSTSYEPIEVETIHPFFPLKVGYKWYYNSNRDTGDKIDSVNYNLIHEVIGSKIINKRKFYLIGVIDLLEKLNTKYIDTLYYSLNNDTLFTILPPIPPYGEKIVVKSIFSLNVGDSFIRESYFDLFNSTVQLIQKTNDRLEFYGRNPRAFDSEYKEIYIKNIGLYEERSLAWGRGIILVKKEFN